MNIIDLGALKPGRKRPNTGFYIVGNCPKCTMPLYWHGPGVMNEKDVDEMLYPSCLCDWEGEMELQAPDDYTFEIERHSLNILFRNMYSMIQEINRVQQETASDSVGEGAGNLVRSMDGEGLEERDQ